MFILNIFKPLLQKLVVLLVFLIKAGSNDDQIVIHLPHPTSSEILEIELEVLPSKAKELFDITQEIEALKKKIKESESDDEHSLLNAQLATKQSMAIALAQQGLNQQTLKNLESKL